MLFDFNEGIKIDISVVLSNIIRVIISFYYFVYCVNVSEILWKGFGRKIFFLSIYRVLF